MGKAPWTALAALLISTTANAGVIVISPPNNASPAETLAARELQRYIYLRTGALPEVSDKVSSERIMVARRDHVKLKEATGLKPQEYILKTSASSGRRTWWIVGGDDAGVLYGAYRFAEKLGVRFYLHGDVAPDQRLARLPDVNETGRPIFSIRGIQPFHDFAEGPDWWNTDDYLAYISQLPKMRMNFIGLHCYPEGIAEPSVWIGTSSDVDDQGRVRFSYPARWANTALDGAWGYAALPTSQYTSGAGLLFPHDQYGPDALDGCLPTPTSPDQCNRVFENAASMLRAAFALARSLGVKTCVGTETPITIPALVKERLKQQGRDPADPKVVREVYEGIFRRIAGAYPVDYYWLWTPEGWTWSGNTDEQLKAITDDIGCALSALDSLGKPFTLATCGWVLGPANDRAALDKVLPKDCPMSCINRSVGHAPVEPSFGDIHDRPKWAIPWMENDPALTAPQPWVGRMRYDAADAKRLGCTGLLGIHWRTKQMCQNVAALAQAGWDQSWVPASFRVAREKQENRIGPLGGQVVTYSNPVDGTDEDPIYQSVRYNVDGYRLAVPNGVYTVTLKFNEPHYGETGKRVFGVKLQGRPVIEHLDMVAKAGQNKAINYTYPDTKVSDGSLRIDFTREVEFPCIAGIVIEGRTDAGSAYARRINCGGRRWQGYEADNSATEDKMDRRTMPVSGFYTDFARASFGDAVAARAGKIMAQIDGRGMPEPVGWLGGPGGVAPNKEPWEKVKERYAFVDEFAALRSKVTSPGDRERFDYWLNTYRYARTLGELGCLRGELDARMAAIEAEADSARRQALAREALDVRVRLSRLWEQAIALQLAAVDTPGEMGTIDNLERHSRIKLQFLNLHDEALAKALGSPLPESIALSTAYSGPGRIIVPTVRTQVRRGEALRLRVIVLDTDRPSEVSLNWRPLGKGAYRRVTPRNIGRATYEAQLPPATGSFEYYVTARTTSGKLVWPATAPKISQTVVAW